MSIGFLLGAFVLVGLLTRGINKILKKRGFDSTGVPFLSAIAVAVVVYLVLRLTSSSNTYTYYVLSLIIWLLYDVFANAFGSSSRISNNLSQTRKIWHLVKSDKAFLIVLILLLAVVILLQLIDMQFVHMPFVYKYCFGEKCWWHISKFRNPVY